MKKIYEGLNKVLDKISTVSVYFGAVVLFLIVLLM